jgi:hypothetical protein
MAVGTGGVKFTVTVVAPAAGTLSTVQVMSALLPASVQVATAAVLVEELMPEIKLVRAPLFTFVNVTGMFNAASGPELVNPNVSFIGLVRFVVVLVGVGAGVFARTLTLRVALNAGAAMFTSTVRRKVAATEVPLELFAGVVSVVETCGSNATTPLNESVATAPGPVIEVKSGGVIGTVTSTNRPIPIDATEQSIFTPLREQVAPVVAPTIKSPPGFTGEDVSEIVDKTFSAVSGPLFLMRYV